MRTKQVPVLWACFLLWNLFVSSSQTANPGIKARITQRALDYGVQVGMKIMEEMAKEIVIPDLKGSESLEFLKIDYVKYNFSNIKINAFSMPNTSLAFVPGVGIRALSNHGTANISANWEVRAPLFQDSGAADLFLSGIYFTGIIVLARNNVGHPVLELQDCYVQVSHARVSFSGGLSVLYNSFAEPMEKPILRNLNEMLCPMVINEVEALNVNISALEVLTKIDNYTVLDCSLISPPEITENHLDLNLKGAFYPVESLVDPPFLPAPFELPQSGDSMLYIGISEYFFKSASFAHYVSGALGITLSTKEVSYFTTTTTTITAITIIITTTTTITTTTIITITIITTIITIITTITTTTTTTTTTIITTTITTTTTIITIITTIITTTITIIITTITTTTTTIITIITTITTSTTTNNNNYHPIPPQSPLSPPLPLPSPPPPPPS
ncbi:BPI fold-containing family C protein [Microtus ochrogaster]|uniref:Bactericidal permeability-increasing protein n=1 Tax=Microtus ochrogaster TaxID=79684 RepID=A0A8J6FZK1_MICOH|nr:BPI fold-containing family C protein [Microtus ochrogaster]